MGKPSRPRLVFTDHVTWAVLRRLVRLARGAETVWHFEPIPGRVARGLALLKRIGLIRAEVRQVDGFIGQIRDEAGALPLDTLWEHVRRTTVAAKEGGILTDPLVRHMAKIWPLEKIALHFEKLIETEFRNECFRIHLIDWMLRERFHVPAGESVLLARRSQWHRYLAAHARQFGIRMRFYGSRAFAFVESQRRSHGLALPASERARGPSAALAAAKHLAAATLRRVVGIFRRRASAPAAPGAAEAAAPAAPPTHTVAIRYETTREITFEPTTRSAFFCLDGAGLPENEVLVYGFSAPQPLAPGTLAELRRRGIRVFGQGQGISAWRPTPRATRLFVRHLGQIGAGLLSGLVRGRLPTLFALLGLVGLARSYAFWYDFFETHRVRVALAPLYHFTVPQTLALDALGGVTAAYQYALGGLNGSWVSAGENVQFVFGRQFERAWYDLGAPVHCLVRTGFIDDSAIRRIRAAGGRPEPRQALAAAGAKYVLCFFDENTHNAWWCFYWHDDAVRDYEFLCRWLLEDPTLGIVIKPKRQATLADRIRPVADLVERAKATGRLLFLPGNRYPTEAALNADLVVGKFVGGTASLEARLAGLPAVMVNTEGLRVNPQWEWTKDRVVFADWPSARAAIEAHRRDPAAHPAFGDWSPGLPDLDPFRDGEAGLRIGLFLRWTYDALKAGAEPEDAVLGACDAFDRRWRSGEITILRRPAPGREPQRSPRA